MYAIQDQIAPGAARRGPPMNWCIMPYLDCPELTAQAVADVMAQRLPDVRLLLIDNGSQTDVGRALGKTLAKQYDGRVYLWSYDPALPSLAAVWNGALNFVWSVGGTYAWVVNNDVRLHPDTYGMLLRVQRSPGLDPWFVSAVGVREGQFDPDLDLEAAAYTDGYGREGAAVDTIAKGGPDFSCYVITRECHRWFQFDEGFVPAYHEDNDYHRRLELAGFGDRIFGINLPFLHYGSGTLEGNPQMRETWGRKFQACQQYYIQKWGGLPGQETYPYPFDMRNPGAQFDMRTLLTGQGKPGCVMPTTRDLFGKGV